MLIPDEIEKSTLRIYKSQSVSVVMLEDTAIGKAARNLLHLYNGEIPSVW